MPLHDYDCSKCNKTIEILKNIKDDTDELCPDCGSVMERLIGLSNFYIKGYAPSKALKSANELRRKNEKHKKSGG